MILNSLNEHMDNGKHGNALRLRAGCRFTCRHTATTQLRDDNVHRNSLTTPLPLTTRRHANTLPATAPRGQHFRFKRARWIGLPAWYVTLRGVAFLPYFLKFADGT